MTVHTNEPRPMLPVLLNNGRFNKVLWGRSESQPGDLPLGYSVDLSTLKKGEWSTFNPRRVIVPYIRFLISKPNGQQFWKNTYPHHHLQAVIAQYQREYRLYIVMIQPDLINQPYTTHGHARWTINTSKFITLLGDRIDPRFNSRSRRPNRRNLSALVNDTRIRMRMCCQNVRHIDHQLRQLTH